MWESFTVYCLSTRRRLIFQHFPRILADKPILPLGFAPFIAEGTGEKLATLAAPMGCPGAFALLIEDEKPLMESTSISLIDRLRTQGDEESWNRLVTIYSPLLKDWLERYQVQASDADDLVQEVMLAIAKDLQQFEHRGREGCFRSWMRAILVNRLRGFWRARARRPSTPGYLGIEQQLVQLEDPTSALSQAWNLEHDRYVLRQLLRLVEPHFSTKTWQAFYRVTFDDARPDAVAQELGLSVNAVFIARSRVLSRLRQEAAGLIDASELP